MELQYHLQDATGAIRAGSSNLQCRWHLTSSYLTGHVQESRTLQPLLSLNDLEAPEGLRGGSLKKMSTSE